MEKKIQQDPSKSFGSTSYFQNKDEQRRVVNDMRRQERNQRIAQQGLTRNIKKAIRKGENPQAYIDAAKKMGLDPLGGGGLGPEAGQRDAALRAKAAAGFEEIKKQRQKSDKAVGNKKENIEEESTTSAVGSVGSSTAGSSDTTNAATTSTATSLPTNVDNDKFSTDLGKKADAYYKKVEVNYLLENSPLGKSGGNNVTEKAFRTGLFKAMKMAKTVEEINELRRVAERSGIDVGKFNTLVKPSLVEGAPDWAKDVDGDRTFKGEDLTRFAGKTKEEARQMIMSQKAANDMRYFDGKGKAYAQKEDDAYNQMINEVAATKKQQDNIQKEQSDIDRRTKEALDPTNIAKQKTDFAKTQEFPKAFEEFSRWDFQEGVNWIDRFNEKTTASMDQSKARSQNEQRNDTANIMRDAQVQRDAQSQADQIAREDQQKSIDFNAGIQTNENTRVPNMITSANRDLFNRSTKGKIYNTGSAMVEAVAKATSSIFNNTNPYYIK
jgi:hypothetical protein